MSEATMTVGKIFRKKTRKNQVWFDIAVHYESRSFGVVAKVKSEGLACWIAQRLAGIYEEVHIF